MLKKLLEFDKNELSIPFMGYYLSLRTVLRGDSTFNSLYGIHDILSLLTWINVYTFNSLYGIRSR